MEQQERATRAIHLYIPRELYLLPLTSTLTGVTLGLLRGSRAESYRFLAENAHRPPTTVQGWYFYQKTKNYRVLLGGLKQGGKDGLKLGSVGLLWVGIEEGARRSGLAEWKSVFAGVGTAGLISAVYRMPRRTATRIVLMGAVAGGAMTVLERARDEIGGRVGEKTESS